MADTVVLNGCGQYLAHVVLSDHLGKRRRPKLAVKRAHVGNVPPASKVAFWAYVVAQGGMMEALWNRQTQP